MADASAPVPLPAPVDDDVIKSKQDAPPPPPLAGGGKPKPPPGGLPPVLLVPGIGGSMLATRKKDEAGEGSRAWVRVVSD